MIQTTTIQASLSQKRLEDLLTRMSAMRIGVLGDFVLDGYWHADMTRSQLSRETPLFPRPVVKEAYSCGGAANVAWNLRDLGVGEVRAFTLLGDDWRGELLRAALAKIGVELGSIVHTGGWMTPFFGKIILTSGSLQQEDARVDFINPQAPPEASVQAVLSEVERSLPDLNGVVVADYLPNGIVSRLAAGAASALAARHPHKVWVVDSRDQMGQFTGMVMKPNDLEAARMLLPGRDEQDVSLEALAQAGMEHQQTGLPLYITLNSRGCLVLYEGKAWQVPAVLVTPPLDPVGAGDSFLAALAAGLSVGASPLEAGCLANLAAGVTVRKLHITGTASPLEILQTYDALKDPLYGI